MHATPGGTAGIVGKALARTAEPLRPSLGETRIEAGGMTMDILVLWLGNAAGRLVNNRTGLPGFYDLQLDFAPELSAGAQPTSGDAPPDVFTAVREQLGLKLEPEKARAPVFVVDSIQRPSEN